MKTDTVELKFKFWVFWTIYCSLFTLIITSISIYPYFVLKKSLGYYFLILIFGFLTLGLHYSHITLTPDSISCTLFFLTCRIPYTKIEKIKASKNKIKIYGAKEVISINRIEYTKFDEAIRFISSKIDNSGHVTFEGKTKYKKQLLSHF